MTQKRGIPFSAKAKKKQLQNKREEKRANPDITAEKRKFTPTTFLENAEESSAVISATESVNQQPGRGRNVNRFNLKFHKETKEEIEQRKEEARKAIIPESSKGLELGSDFCFIPGLEFPHRPKWDYSLSQQMLDMKENKYFREYIENIEKTFQLSELSSFELNLETWRQLWRVLEMSDILLVVVDARFPSLLFPPSLYDFVTNKIHRDVILVFNKIDLVPAVVLAAWKHYFETVYPKLKIVFFTSLPSYNLQEGSQPSGLKGSRRKGKMRMTAEGALNLWQVCQEICQNQVDLSGWRAKIAEEMTSNDEDGEVEVGLVHQEKKNDVSYHQQTKFHNGLLTIGCIGQPNVGKSSLINALMGKKVVSVSRTPGHTKHFQTIFLTQNVKLCDCPGLIFPSKLTRNLQILTGSYPIAHLREPYTAVGYLGKYLDFPNLLKIQHPSEENEWSAYDICEGWAIKRGFMTKKAARPDVARAANHLLRLSLEGRINLYIRPPNFSNEEEQWKTHPYVQDIIANQALLQSHNVELEECVEEEESSTDEELSNKGSDDSDDESSGATAGASCQNKFALLGDDE